MEILKKLAALVAIVIFIVAVVSYWPLTMVFIACVLGGLLKDGQKRDRWDNEP